MKLIDAINWLPDRSYRWRKSSTVFAAFWMLADVVLITCGLWKWIELLTWMVGDK